MNNTCRCIPGRRGPASRERTRGPVHHKSTVYSGGMIRRRSLPPAWRSSYTTLTGVSIGVILVKAVGKRNPEHTCVSTALSCTRSFGSGTARHLPAQGTPPHARRRGPARPVPNRRPIFRRGPRARPSCISGGALRPGSTGPPVSPMLRLMAVRLRV